MFQVNWLGAASSQKHVAPVAAWQTTPKKSTPAVGAGGVTLMFIASRAAIMHVPGVAPVDSQ